LEKLVLNTFPVEILMGFVILFLIHDVGINNEICILKCDGFLEHQIAMVIA
jgi:hypothetical protein